MIRLTTDEKRRLLIGLLAFFLIQVLGASFLVYKERHALLADKHLHFDSDLALVSLATQSFLQNKNYSAIEYFMEHWLRRQTETVREIRIFKPTGETLYHYCSTRPVAMPLTKSNTIDYALGGEAVIELTYELADIEQNLFWTYLWLGTAAVITNIVFWLMMRLVLLRQREAKTLSSRTEELSSANAQLRLQAQIVDQTHDAIISTNTEGRIISWNKGAEKLLGFAEAETHGQPLQCLFSEEEYAFFQKELFPLLLRNGQHEGEARLRRKSGENFAAHLSLSRLQDQNGNFSGMVCYALDISERKKNEDWMRLAAKFLDNTTEALLVTDAEGTIIEVNTAFEEMAGFKREEVLGENPRILKSDRHDKAFYEKMWEQLNARGHWQGEIWDRRKNGEVYPKWLSISTVHDERGKLTHYVAISADISDVKQNQERLEYLAHYDQLTGLPNRLLFNDRLQQAIRHATRTQQQVAVIVLDLDRFKEVNDTLGHSAGDALLVEVAAQLNNSIRGSDTVCRMGGDEFIIMMPAVGEVDNVIDIAQKLLSAFSRPFCINGNDVYITPSIGISMYPQDSKTQETLIKNADTAMYHAKREGRNNFQFYQESMYNTVLERLTLKSRLHQALDRDEFQLFYQIKVDSVTEEVVGAEALIRWLHPEDGFINPGRFIPLAEESDLILPIGQWVIREACTQNMMLHKIGLAPINIAVNLSARQLHQQNIPEIIKTILLETGLPAKYLSVEITESMLMQDVENTINTLAAIKEMGLSIAIDDFGTGYSSLNYLKRFPIDILKVDRSFVMDIDKDHGDRAVIASIITLAHNLKLKVVAEGVETREELEFLKAHDCDMIQGYYFSRPLPWQDFTALLKERQKNNPTSSNNIRPPG
jgi:diguanylate cyclase (GGDEF)-like protein/PAS domain S-box-containing protein